MVSINLIPTICLDVFSLWVAKQHEFKTNAISTVHFQRNRSAKITPITIAMGEANFGLIWKIFRVSFLIYKVWCLLRTGFTNDYRFKWCIQKAFYRVSSLCFIIRIKLKFWCGKTIAYTLIYQNHLWRV